MRKLFNFLTELKWILMSPINYCRAYVRIFWLMRAYRRGRTIWLDLKDLHLPRVPWVLYFFPSLEIALYLSNNRISKFPKWLKKFDFYAVDLSKNRLTEFPTAILSYANLKFCNLSLNKIEEIPIGIKSLKNVDILNLEVNRIKYIPESIGELKALEMLHLSGNQLKELPKSIGKLQKLRKLGLGHNQLKELPKSIGKLQDLRTLELGYNQLTHLSNEILLLPKLENLILNNNLSLQQLPDDIGLLEQLIYLNIEKTGITTFPQSIWNLKMIKDSNYLRNKGHHSYPLPPSPKGLDLSTAQFKIPKFLNHKSPTEKVEYILASEEERKNIKWGYIQEKLESAKKWRGLNLKNFGLEKFPFSLEELQDIPLLEIDLSDNNLTELPSFIGELKTLKVLQLRNNQLKTLPNELTQLPNLKRLSLRHNKLIELPNNIGKLQQLQHLSLSNNEFQKLPDSIGELQQLKSLGLSYNNLKELPFSLEKLHNLEYLDLDNNQYSIWTTLRLALLKPKEKIRYLLKRQRKRY